MPLPAALAARLAKRGLLKKTQPENEPVEEVFAEDYDDPSNPKSRPDDMEFGSIEQDEEMSNELVHETLACPNKGNRYHVCVEYCHKRWGPKKFQPDPDMLKKKEHMLNKYPIPAGWLEVGDPESGRYYYWNTQTDEVSWLPPSHPRANVSLPAERIKELASERGTSRRDSQGESGSSSGDDSTDLDDEDIDDIDDKDYGTSKVRKEAPPSREQNKKRRRNDDLDPMDPAAYSDVPRGDWSTGLDQRGSAKTGVDVTASGPLFQQRPYPSPGAVLRMNKGPGKDKKPSSDD